MPLTRKLLRAQIIFLFLGTIYAWSRLMPQVAHFIEEYGTLFRFTDISVPNPLTTACLYGSIAFLVVLFWSVLIYQTPSLLSQKNLRNMLLFCVVFAASVVAYEALVYYKIFFSPSTSAFICTPGVPPTETPCFYGMLFFIVAFITSIFATLQLRQSDRIPG